MIYNKEIIRFTIPLLLKCNLNCSYCNVPNEKNEYLDYTIFKKALLFFFNTEGYQKDLVLYGGEPLLLGKEKLSKYLQILEEIKNDFVNKDITVTLVTNLTVLDNNLEKLLEKVDFIAVSIDGNKKSHNLNRGLFENTYSNLKKLIKNKELKNKLSINKVVNKKNVYSFFEDVKFLLDEFNIEIFYNGALAVSDWDKKSVEELNTQLKKIYSYGKNNNILNKLGNFFKIPLNGCPFGTLSLSLNGKIYNCEFMANDYINTQGYVLDLINNKLNLDIKECFYNLTSRKCLDELCMGCGKFCTKFSFQEGKFLNTNGALLLKKVKNVRFNHLQYYEEELQKKFDSSLNIRFFNLDYKSVFKIYNFLYSLESMLGIKKFNIIFDKKDNNYKIINILFKKLLARGNKNLNINISNKNLDFNIIVSVGKSYVFNSKNEFIGNMNSEIIFFS